MSIIAISGKICSGKTTVTNLLTEILAEHRPQENWEFKRFAHKLKQIASIMTGIPVEHMDKQEVKSSFLPSEWDRLVWNDPDPIPGTDYTVTFREDYGDTSLIQYGGGSEAEVPNDELISSRMTLRELLQKLGTDAMRDKVHPDIHVNGLFADYNMQAHSGPTRELRYPKWIVDDCRFRNEAHGIERHAGIMIRIERDTELRFPELWAEWEALPGDELDEWDEFLIAKDEYEKIYHPSETDLDGYPFPNVIYNNGTIEDLREQLTQILIKEKLIHVRQPEAVHT